ncbi:putative transmembrane protein, partial [Gregarina niphandrodes]
MERPGSVDGTGLAHASRSSDGPGAERGRLSSPDGIDGIGRQDTEGRREAYVQPDFEESPAYLTDSFPEGRGLVPEVTVIDIDREESRTVVPTTTTGASVILPTEIPIDMSLVDVAGGTEPALPETGLLGPTATVQQLTTFDLFQAVGRKTTVGMETKDYERFNVGAIERLNTISKDRGLQGWKGVLRRIWEDFVPKGVKGNRLGIQWTMIQAVSSILIYMRPPAHYFWGPVWGGLSVFICINAITTCDIATGATTRNAALRILGTTLAAALSFLFMVPMVLNGLSGYEDNDEVRWILYFACVASPFFWNFWIHHFPSEMEENFTYQGFSTHVYLYGNYSTKIVYDMCICTLGSYIGAVLGFIGYQFIVPLRARDKIVHEVSLVCDKMSAVLEPLIGFESGFKIKGMRPLDGRRKKNILTKTNTLFKQTSKAIRKSISRNASKEEGMTAADSDDLEATMISLDDFRDHVWTLLGDSSKLMQGHPELLKNATVEHYWRKPHFFKLKKFQLLYNDCVAIYYHVSSLFLILQTQLTTTHHRDTFAELNRHWDVPHTGQPESDYGGLFAPSQKDDESVLSASMLSASMFSASSRDASSRAGLSPNRLTSASLEATTLLPNTLPKTLDPNAALDLSSTAVRSSTLLDRSTVAELSPVPRQLTVPGRRLTGGPDDRGADAAP